MILPGTGKQGVDLDGKKINGIIRIVDDAVVTKRDLGNNFFARRRNRRPLRGREGDSSGTQSDDTMVTSDVQNVDRLISSNPTYFDDFTLVIGAQLSRKSALAMDELCRAKGIPLILGKINGLIGYVRNCVNCHEVIESKPGDFVHRLHGRDPWPELIELSKQVSVDVASQKSVGDKLKMHKEVPWLLLLVNKIQEEKAKSGLDLNEICTNYSKRSEFLRNLCKDSESFIDPINEQKYQEGLKAGKSEDDLNQAMAPSPAMNYSEARLQGGTCLKPFRLPNSPEFEALMNDDRIKSKTPPKLGNDFSGNFWKMARALNRFLEKHKRFPVRKEVPDMEAGNKYYVMLKECFLRKAKADFQLFREELKVEYVVSSLERHHSNDITERHHSNDITQTSSLNNISRTQTQHTTRYGESMPEDDAIERFCHNAPFVEVFRTSALKEEMTRDLSDDIDELVDDEMYEANGGDIDLHPFKFYLLLRAADSFYEEHGRYPGWTDETLKEDTKNIKTHISKILASHQLDEDYLNDNHANEIVRYGGSEIPCYLRHLGTETTKMITHQFQLLQSTFV